MKMKMRFLSDIMFFPPKRDFCSCDDDHFKNNHVSYLADMVNHYYLKDPSRFTLSPSSVQKIVTSIILKSYNFSLPKVVKIIDRNPSTFYIFQNSNIEPNGYFCYEANDKDDVVLFAMIDLVRTYYITSSFVRVEALYLFAVYTRVYNTDVVNIGKVKKLYNLDLSNTYLIIDRHKLFMILSKMNINSYILYLIKEFCQFNKVLLPNGEVVDYSQTIFVDRNGEYFKPRDSGIMPVGIFSQLLLTIYLSSLDILFMDEYPDFEYRRYGPDIFIAVPHDKKEIDNPIEVFTTLFKKLQLTGNISIISPGDQNIKCITGMFGISHDGYIECADDNFSVLVKKDK